MDGVIVEVTYKVQIKYTEYDEGDIKQSAVKSLIHLVKEYPEDIVSKSVEVAIQ